MKRTRILIPALLLVAVLALALGASTQAAPFQVPTNPGTTGLISWWSLDETSGVRYDSHGSNHLSDNNTVDYAAGVVGNAADFEATNYEYLSHASNADLSTGDIDFTLALFVNFETKNNYARILSKENVGVGKEYSLLYYADLDQIGFAVYNSASAEIATVRSSSFGSLSLGTYYYVIAWHNAGANTINLQVNDGPVNSISTGGQSPANLGQPVIFGGRLIAGSISTVHDGLLDEVVFYKKVLSADERTWLYNAGAGRSYDEVNPPAATPTPTNTAIPPTNTPLPPTNTPLPPTNTPLPPTNTPLSPTDTPLPPTDTPLPPTDTPLPPTDTPLPGTATNTPLPGLATEAPTPFADLQWDMSISAGEYAIVGSNAVLILLFVVGGLIALTLTVIEKRKRE